jgi:hypothetical protein
VQLLRRLLSILGRHTEAVALVQQSAKRNPLLPAIVRPPRPSACMKRDATARPKSRFSRGPLDRMRRMGGRERAFWAPCILATGRADRPRFASTDSTPLRGTSYHAVALASAGRRTRRWRC